MVDHGKRLELLDNFEADVSGQVRREAGLAAVEAVLVTEDDKPFFDFLAAVRAMILLAIVLHKIQRVQLYSSEKLGFLQRTGWVPFVWYIRIRVNHIQRIGLKFQIGEICVVGVFLLGGSF